jgi:hypothetical protein
MSTHAPLAPSSAHRWINCPGSFTAAAAVPGPPSSSYAEEGTRAHDAFARCLLQGLQATDVFDDPTLAAPLQEALDHARTIIGGRSVLIEQRLPPLPGVPDIWGTADIAVFDQDLHLSDVIDLKFGAYVVVEANTVQTGIYGLLGIQRFGFSSTGLTTWIIQPRAFHPDGPARSHHYDRAALRDLYRTVRTAAEAARNPLAPRRFGAWCRFCPAASSCLERQTMQGPEELSAWSRR